MSYPAPIIRLVTRPRAAVSDAGAAQDLSVPAIAGAAGAAPAGDTATAKIEIAALASLARAAPSAKTVLLQNGALERTRTSTAFTTGT